ncbi:MAG: redox-sensing transcriptional repressor Rex, partial [Candidatus Omnitrophota bacterium]
GKGYSVSGLKKEIPGILGIDRPLRVAIVGAGNLGMALLSYRGFREQGFSIVAAFDNDQRKIGGRFRDVVIQDIAELAAAVRTKKIEMAVVAVPAAAAATAITALIRARVGAILNFAPVRLQVPSTVELINIDLSIELEKLAHFLRRTDRHREPIAGSSGGPHAKRKR